MKIKVRFTHHKKNPNKYATPSTFHFDADCSTGPVIERGTGVTMEFDVKVGDTIEFATTRFEDEFDVFHKRRGRILNGPTAAEKRKAERDRKALRKKMKKNGNLKDDLKIEVIDMKKLTPRQRKKIHAAERIAKDIMKHEGKKS